MKRSDGIRIAVFSLLENPLRSFLTLLGIAIGVTAVIFVVSVIEGLNGYVAEALDDLGPDVMVIDKYGIIKGREGWLKARRRNKDIRVEDAEAIRRQARTVSAVSVARWSGTTIKHGASSIANVPTRGVSVEALEIEPFHVSAGRPFAPHEVEHAQRVCFLGYDVADQLFGSLDPLAKDVTLFSRKFHVIGVAEQKGSLFGHSQDNYILIPLTVYEKMFGTWGSVNISVKAVDPKRMEQTVDEVRGILRARRGLRLDEEDNFGIITSDGVMGFWHDLTKMIFRVAVFVVSVSLVVGGIVIMNIMLLTVVERTREIGVRKAVGARQRDIRFQFLIESLILCAVGGLTGVGFAWLSTWGVRNWTPLPAAFPLWAPALAVSVTSVVGIFFGLHPARKAAALDPIEALRSEAT